MFYYYWLNEDDGGNRKTERDGASRGRTNFQQKIMCDRKRYSAVPACFARVRESKGFFVRAKRDGKEPAPVGRDSPPVMMVGVEI